MKKILLIALLTLGLYANQDINKTIKKLSQESISAYKEGNYCKVIDLEEQSFKLGNSISATYIASMYRYKLIDHKKAIMWYKKGVEQKAPTSAYNLAGLYENYENFKEAEKYYLIANKLGYKSASYALGLLYEDKLHNDDKAIEWYKKAIDIGDPNGAFALGLFYRKVKLDYKEAEKWYLKAVAMNDKRTYYSLARMYELDTKEYEKALAMYKKVVQRKPNKSPKSKEAIKRLEKLLEK